jgi:hypothetical protein
MAEKTEPEREYKAGEHIIEYPRIAEDKFASARVNFTRGSLPGESTLAGSLSAGGSNAKLPAGHVLQFPVGGWIGIGESERCRVLSKTGDELVLFRPNAGNHLAGARVQLLDCFKVIIEKSENAGATWEEVASNDTPGGAHLDRNGFPRNEIDMGYLHHLNGSPRDRDGIVRCRIVTKMPFTSTVKLTLERAADVGSNLRRNG